MNLLFVIVAAVLTELAFVVMVRKLHDRSIHQVFSRACARVAGKGRSEDLRPRTNCPAPARGPGCGHRGR